MDTRLLYECKLLKQLVYKVKNQLGKTVQYRRLMHVYKSLKKHLQGIFVENFQYILQIAGESVVDSLSKKFLVPIFTLLLSVYARISFMINNPQTHLKTKIISRKLKKIMNLSQTTKKKIDTDQKNKFKEIENFLETIRIQL